eukprot:TRINITY_DN45002_c0_g1_i1.p1 TRINITY_DN45002_c0_g1~~TRINITY_DN45002_c0_g1_i1.p1  ORF type:complete len:105 (-),score=4.33 TRINITY_DN45002_c0_g1_i1:292-606(-)
MVHLASYLVKSSLMALYNWLATYSIDMCSNNEFLEVNRISNLDKMVEAKRDILYPLIYLLSTTLCRGCFLLCIPYIIDLNEMEDKCMNDCLCYIHQERHLLKSI